MLAVLIAFFSSASYAACNIVDAHISGSLFKKVSTVVFYVCVTNILTVPFLFFFGTPQAVPMSVLPYLLIVGFLDFIYLMPYYAALKKVDTSIVAALFSLSKVFLPFLAYMIVGEKLGTMQYAGFAIVILFSLILNIENPKKLKINTGFWLMLFSSFVLTFQVVLCKKVLNDLDWVSTVFYLAIATTSTSFLLFIPKKSRIGIVSSFGSYKKNIKMFLLAEVFDRMANMSCLAALSVLPVVAAEAISSTQPIFVLIYGVALFALFGNRFKEDVSKNHIIKKTVCFLFIIAGVVLVLQ